MSVVAVQVEYHDDECWWSALWRDTVQCGSSIPGSALTVDMEPWIED